MSPQDKHTIIASATVASPPTRRRLIGTPKIDSASDDRIDYCSDCLAYALGAVSNELGTLSLLLLAKMRAHSEMDAWIGDQGWLKKGVLGFGFVGCTKMSVPLSRKSWLL